MTIPSLSALALAATLSLILSACSEAVTPTAGDLQLEEVAAGLAVPWGMAFVSETEILITEKPGTVQRLDLETGILHPVAGAPAVVDAGQGGLLDVAVSPNYDNDRWLYFTYSKVMAKGAATALGRARLEGDQLVDWQELFVSNLVSDARVHFGSRIAFDGKGHVFFSHGDRGDRDQAQNLANHAGTILRLNLDGSIPVDNPHLGRAGAMPEIWSHGHRNPQGLVYDTATDRLWAIEHGPRGGDELNLVLPGRNYGWPVVSHGKEYALPKRVGEATSKPGMEDPLKVYVPSIAPGSLLLYRGDKHPEWRGNLFAGALAMTHLNRIVLDRQGAVVDEVRYLEQRGDRIRSLAAGPDGTLYLGVDGGRVLRVVSP